MFKNQSIQAEHFRSLILKPITTTRNGSNRTQQCRIPVTEKLAATRAYLRGKTEATTCSKGGIWFACGKYQGENEEEGA